MEYAASISDEFTNLLGNVVNIAVKVVIFLAIMALGWFVASWLRKWLTRILQRVGLDRAVERGGLHRMLGSNSASNLTARLVVLGFLLFVLQLAFGIFGPNPVSQLISDVVAWLPRLFVAVVIIVVAAAVAGWLKELIAEALGGLAYGRTIATIVQVVVLALGVMAALNQIGIATTVTLPVLVAALFTIGGVIVVGVGGGLVKPMQHRWERMLNRAETETTLATERVRAHRARADRDVNRPSKFEQPAYGRARTDEKPPATAPADAETEIQQPPRREG
jgi:Mechanosensitive ion channel, conserved TM helix